MNPLSVNLLVRTMNKTDSAVKQTDSVFKTESVSEGSRRQFKQDVTNADALATEMAAFANSEGGVIFLGVVDDGSAPGLSLMGV